MKYSILSVSRLCPSVETYKYYSSQNYIGLIVLISDKFEIYFPYRALHLNSIILPWTVTTGKVERIKIMAYVRKT
jgi:hypothetical protein